MSGKWEIPVSDIEAVQEIMQRPLRYRQLAIWDYLLPPDDSLEVYRQNLKAAGKGRAAKLRAAAVARHQDRYGHEADYDQHGQCRVCSTRRYLKSYRLRNDIPLDAPIMSKAEASRLGVAARKRKGQAA